MISSGSTGTVNEGVSAGTTVYTAAATDPAGGTVTYSLTGTDASAFTVNALTGAVTINGIPNFETKPSYSFNVKASDSSGAFNTKAITVSVNDLPPVISSGSTASVNEGVAANTTVYTAAAADPAGGAVTYSLVGADAAAFTINSTTGVVTINGTPDYETQSSYSFDVKASDPSGLFNTKAVTINVNDLNDAPAITSGDPQAGITNSGLSGSSTPAEVSGSLGFVDPDLADHHTVTFSAPTITTTATSYSSAISTALASAFSTSINDSTGSGYGQINWHFSAADNTFDFLGNGQTLTAAYTVTIKDGANATSTQTVTVTVTGTDHIPAFTGGATSAFVTESTTELIANPAAPIREPARWASRIPITATPTPCWYRNRKTARSGPATVPPRCPSRPWTCWRMP